MTAPPQPQQRKRQHAAALGLAVAVCLIATTVAAIGATHSHSDQLLAQQLEKDAERLRGTAERTPAHLQQAYMAHFQLKRREQIAAAEAIFEKPRFTSRFQLLQPLVDEIFRQLNGARKRLEDAGWAPTMPPLTTENAAALDALAQTWQNTAFFGDLVLRMPDPVHAMIDGHAVRLALLRWAIYNVSLPSFVFVERTHRQQLELLLQETGLAHAPDASYVNPFSELHLLQQHRLQLHRKAQSALDVKRALKRALLRHPRVAFVPPQNHPR